VRDDQYRDIENKMEASIRGYSFTMEEARELAVRFLRIMEQSIMPGAGRSATAQILTWRNGYPEVIIPPALPGKERE